MVVVRTSMLATAVACANYPKVNVGDSFFSLFTNLHVSCFQARPAGPRVYGR